MLCLHLNLIESYWEKRFLTPGDLRWPFGARVAKWSGESVSHPAMVQGGGFGFRRNPVTRPSLPPGFGEREGTYLYVAVS